MHSNPGEAIDKPSELKIALDNRTFEIQMFWQRSNYFLVLITALAVGVFTIKSEGVALLITLFTTASSYFWYRTNLGSKFWQESWEVEVVKLAKVENIASFERPTAEIVAQVKAALEGGAALGSKGRIQRFIDKQIATKPSVSHYMTLLSLSSTLMWAIISLVYLYDWIKTLHLGKVVELVCSIGR